MSAPSLICVFRLPGSLLALDATLVGEVVAVDGLTRLAGCAPAVRGLANLRGRALAVVDLDLLLGGAGATIDADTLVVLRIPGRECGLLVERVDGVLAGGNRRNVDHLVEPGWIAGFQDLPDGGTAALLDIRDLSVRLDTLRFRPQSQAAA
jgi:chemotaxis signal transduction protein